MHYYCLGIWVSALFVALMPLLGDGYVLQPPGIVCLSLSGSSPVVQIDFILLSSPLIIVVLAYLKMFSRVKLAFSTARLGPTVEAKAKKAEKKIFRQFVVIVVIFVFLFLPASLDWFLIITKLVNGSFTNNYKLFQSFSWMICVSNCAANPLIIMSMNQDVRNELYAKYERFFMLQRDSEHLKGTKNIARIVVRVAPKTADVPALSEPNTNLKLHKQIVPEAA